MFGRWGNEKAVAYDTDEEDDDGLKLSDMPSYLGFPALGIFTANVWLTGQTLNYFGVLVCGALLGILADEDTRKRRVGVNYLAYLLLTALANQPWTADRVTALAHVSAGVVCLGIFFLVSRVRPGSVGRGDLYLASWAGLMFGFEGGLLVLMLACVCGAVAGIIIRKKDHTLPFAAMLLGGWTLYTAYLWLQTMGWWPW